MKHIVLLVDLTGVAQVALEHTAIIARKSICLVTLLHIAPDGSQYLEKEIKANVRAFASSLEDEGVSFSVKINYGEFFDVIAGSINAIACDLLIVGTHGIKGFKQNFMSSNIIRLIGLINVPALIVQGHSSTPQEGYGDILVPLIGTIQSSLIDQPLTQFAEIFHSKMHFLSYYNPENTSAMQSCTRELESHFKSSGFSTVVQMEESSVYASNFSRSVVQYADIEDIEVILLILHEPNGMKNFDALDKENILLNRFGKAVLCL